MRQKNLLEKVEGIQADVLERLNNNFKEYRSFVKNLKKVARSSEVLAEKMIEPDRISEPQYFKVFPEYCDRVIDEYRTEIENLNHQQKIYEEIRDRKENEGEMRGYEILRIRKKQTEIEKSTEEERISGRLPRLFEKICAEVKEKERFERKYGTPSLVELEKDLQELERNRYKF